MKPMHGMLPTDRAAPPQKSPMRSISTENGLNKSPVKPSQIQSSTAVPYDVQLESFAQEKGVLENKITQLQTYLKQWQQERETKDKKHFKLEGALNEVIYYIEECSVLKQSIKELRVLFSKNEGQLRQFVELRRDPKLTLAERPELEMKIRNLLEENKKNKEIEDGLVSNLKINEQELSVLKNMILKTFEDQLALILCSEVKELQLKKENIVQKMANISLSQELNLKMTFLAEQEKTCKKLLEDLELEKKEKTDLQQKVSQLQKSRNFKSGEILKTEPDQKPALYKKPIQFFSTPKTNSKLYNANIKTVESKPQQQQQQQQQAGPVSSFNTTNPNPSFRELNKKDYSKSPKPKAGSFIQTITSPAAVTKGPRFSNKEVFNSKESSTKPKSPMNPAHLNQINEFKKSFSTFKSDDKLLGSPGVPRQRYSDVHEMAKNKPTVAQINLKTQNSEETATSKSGKAKSMNLADVQAIPVKHFLSNDDDFGSVLSVDTYDPTNENNVFDLLGSKDVANKANPVVPVIRQSSSRQKSSGYISIKENLMPGEQYGGFSSKGNNTSIRIGGNSGESQLASLGLNVATSLALARSLDEDWKSVRNSNSMKKDSLNLENIGKSSSKKSHAEKTIMSLRDSDSYVNFSSSTKKKTPQKDYLRDITNTNSSQRRGGGVIHQSLQGSLVKYETSTKKKVQSIYQKYLSSGKNPVLSECDEMRTSLLESPVPEGGIIKNFRF